LRGFEEPWASDIPERLSHAGLSTDLASAALGTIGGGNHFAELLRVEALHEEADVDPTALYLMVHSGSRGLGHGILEQHLAQHNVAGLATGSDGGARISGAEAEAFIADCIGTIRWVGTSSFRPVHKRRNWFVGVQRISTGRETPDLRETDVRYQTLRASGLGGQHFNKTDSAVRATHMPTGLVSRSQDQRAQFADKKIARLKLVMLLDNRRRANEAGGKRELWDQSRELERGNAVRTYEGEGFRRR